MSIIDIVFLLCFIPAIVVGISKGFILQVLEFIALIAGAWAGFAYDETVAMWLGGFLKLDESILRVIAFALIMLVVSITLGLVGKIITRILKSIALGGLNAILGVAFGIFKTVLLLGLLISLFDSIQASMSFLEKDTLEQLDSAPVYNFIKDVSQAIFPMLKSLITNA